VTATLYSTEDVADLLGLHVRTVRGYVRDGRLPAVRIGKQYRIAPEDVDRLTGGRPVESPPPPAATTRVEVSAVVQVDGVDPASSERLTALVTGAMASRSGTSPRPHVETVYDERRRVLKVVALGGADDTARLVALVGEFAESAL
jgi:excisionase family DNA binding protein